MEISYKHHLNLYNNSSIFHVRNQSKHLCKSLESAIENYLYTTWRVCFQKGTEDVHKFENMNDLKYADDDNFNQIWYIACPTTVMKWNHDNNLFFVN